MREEMNNLFRGPSEIYFKSFDAPNSEFEKLPTVDGSLKTIIADNLQIFSDDEELDNSMPISSKQELFFSCDINDSDSLNLKCFILRKQEYLDRAQKMFDEIKSGIKEFHVTNPPRNRAERRARVKALEQRSMLFRAYCKKHDIGIKTAK